MLPDKKTFRLMLMYCGPLLSITGVGSLAAAGVLAFVGKQLITETFVIITILKMGLSALAVALMKLLSSGREEYFYINLGHHPKKLLKMAVCLDSSIYISISTTIMILRNVFFS